MKFDDLDKQMRVFEISQDHCVLPGIYMVARLDGRNFTKLTKEVCDFEAPFDLRFRNYMISTVKHLMNCGFRVIYGYTQSDEISLLFHLKEDTFGRKLRKYNSILSAEASANFSLLLGNIGCFDCRISQLTSMDFVVDYFRWRQEDAHRNSLNSHCYWMLRKKNKSQKEATNFLLKMSVSDKNDLLFDNEVNFNELPLWQKRGMGFYWEDYGKESVNPKTGEHMLTARRRVKCDLHIPMKDEYNVFLRSLIDVRFDEHISFMNLNDHLDSCFIKEFRKEYSISEDRKIDKIEIPNPPRSVHSNKL